MNLFLNCLAIVFLFASCAHSTHDQDRIKDITSIHLFEKKTVALNSPEGKKLFSRINQQKFINLKEFWEPQKPNFCGVCSTVIVSNTLKQNKKLTQDNFFTKKLEQDIIAKSRVSRIGLTLREISDAIKHLNPTFKVETYYSHTSGLDLLYKQLNEYKESDEILITNFSRESIAGTGMKRGHFSIIAGYDKTSKMVLVLEVNAEKVSFWIKAKDLFSAMLAEDTVSRIPRGWVGVKK